MFFVRYRCSQCGTLFKVLRFLVDSKSKRTCPECGAQEMPPVEEDAGALKLEESKRCSSFG